MHDYAVKSNKQLFWNRIMIETLIALYKENECLYNKSHPDYNSHDAKSEVLNNILDKMKQYLPSLRLIDVQQKLKTIRKKYLTEINNVKDAEIRGNTYEPKLWCFDQLQFLQMYNENDDDSSDENLDGSFYSDNESGSKDFMWDRENLKLLINLYKSERLLYDPNHVHYKNRDLRKKAYNKIVNETKKFCSGVDLNLVKAKIKTLRGQYTRELTCIKNARELNKSYIPKVWCFEFMTFLGDCKNEKNSESKSNDIRVIYPQFDDSNISAISQGAGVNESSLVNESYEIEQIHQVLIENEMQNDEITTTGPNMDMIKNNHTVMEYECVNTFDFQDLEQNDNKEISNENRTSFNVRKNNTTEFRTNKKNSNKSDNVEDVTYEWLRDLAISQLGLISPTYHSELTTELQNLIHKYISKSKSNKDDKPESSDLGVQQTPNVSFNIKINKSD